MAPAIVMKKNLREINFFKNIGAKIGLLFQIADDLIDYSGNSKIAGKKTGKDEKKGKATLISLLGYKNAIKYSNKIKISIANDLKKNGMNPKNINETLDYILNRKK
jgi:farnesyl diphosphate synthase